MPHVYKVGQMLDLSSAPLQSNRPKGPCRVLAYLPHEGGPVLYRVQCTNERNERVVEELDLSPGFEVDVSAAEDEIIVSIANQSAVVLVSGLDKETMSRHIQFVRFQPSLAN